MIRRFQNSEEVRKIQVTDIEKSGQKPADIYNREK